jgi:hypothetical protein
MFDSSLHTMRKVGETRAGRVLVLYRTVCYIDSDTHQYFDMLPVHVLILECIAIHIVAIIFQD